jgi:dTDP-glucose pyrophosphorylase
MVDYKVKFFLRMIELGWIPTKYGLIETDTDTDKVVSIIEKS